MFCNGICLKVRNDFVSLLLFVCFAFFFANGCSNELNQVGVRNSSQVLPTSYSLSSSSSGKRTATTPQWWSKVSSRFKKTPLGHPVAVSCHNCYRDTINGKDLSLEEANEKIDDAIQNGANLIEIDLAFDNEQVLCAYHGNPSACDVDGGNSAPRFGDLLDNEVFQDSQALLFIEVKETTSSVSEQEEFARTMLDEIVRHGDTYLNDERPVIFFGRTTNIAVMKTLYQVANEDAYREYRDFMKFGLLFYSTSRSEIESYVNDPDFQMDLIDFDYTIKDVMMLTDLAQSLGLVVGYFTFYSPLYMAALREEADIITTEYVITKTFEVIEENNVMAFVDVSNCGSQRDKTISNFYSVKRKKIFRNPKEMILDLADMAMPTLMDGNDESGYVDCYLSFDSNNQNLVNLGRRDPLEDQGVLVSAYVSFEDLTDIPEGATVIVGNGSDGGFSLELVRESDETILRFGAHINGKFVYDSVSVAETGISEFGSLSTHTPYLIMGGYDGGGGVYILVNNRYNSSVKRSNYYSDITSSSYPILIGAQSLSKKKAQYYFSGLVQKVMVLSWKDR